MILPLWVIVCLILNFRPVPACFSSSKESQNNTSPEVKKSVISFPKPPTTASPASPPPWPECLTTRGGPGRCVDVHLCPLVLQQARVQRVFPRICGRAEKHTSQLRVCCPLQDGGGGGGGQCGVAVPQGQGIEHYLGLANQQEEAAINNHNNKNKLSVLRRSPEHTAILAMAEDMIADDEGNKSDLDGGTGLTNGVEAKLGEFPWAASLGKRTSSGEMFWFCGGSLVSPRWVLTAAHCLTKVRPDLIRLGSVDLRDSSSNSPTIFESAVSHVISHPDFRGRRLYHDLALVKLETPVDVGENRFIQPVCLPDLDVAIGRSVSTAGFGQLEFGGRASHVLVRSRLGLKTVDREECQSRYGKDKLKERFPRGMTEEVICAIDESENSDPCQGDSGGGLVTLVATRGSTAAHVLVGVVTGGIGCGSKRYPGIYADVSHHKKWITETMQKYD